MEWMEEEMGSFRSIWRIWNTRPAKCRESGRTERERDIVNRSRGEHLQSREVLVACCGARSSSLMDGLAIRDIAEVGNDAEDGESLAIRAILLPSALQLCVSILQSAIRKWKHSQIQMLGCK